MQKSKRRLILSKKLLFIILLFCFSLFNTINSKAQKTDSLTTPNHTKLYWFIPDGVRAEPDIFKVFEWAKAGQLPNIAKMMEKGSYGYSLPVFPSQTPVNFATLLSGTFPNTHGISDGSMHVEGYPLSTVSAPGFRSLTRRVPAIWSLMEKEGKKVMVITTPGSTPPEIEDGYILRGRWGGWGADVQAVNFEKKQNGDKSVKPGTDNKLFNIGAELTKYIDSNPASGWKNMAQSFSPAIETQLTSWGDTMYAYIYDNTNDQKINYNSIIFSADKKNTLAELKQGQWSDWCKVNFNINGKSFTSWCKIRVIILRDDGFFRIRIFYNNLNEYICIPDSVVEDINKNVGPMMAFVDNYPPQLINYPEDKNVFLEEMKMSFDWHTRLVPFIQKKYKPDVVIHDCYNPNQMLTSRWWMYALDKKSTRFNDVNDIEREVLWGEVMSMYKRLDSIIGEIMKNADDSTLIVFSSDHGINVRNKSVRLNNLLAKNGYLKFTINDSTGATSVDWKNTKAIFLQMIGVYINPNGLDGNWKRSSGAQYDKLRNEITTLLLNFTDSNGVHPVNSVTKWEDVETKLKLPPDRVGDLVISSTPGYGWSEAMSYDYQLFEVPLISGYKQGLLPESTTSLWTPFIIMGPGVKKGFKVEKNICNADQLPTILKLMGFPIPSYMEGKIVEEILQK